MPEGKQWNADVFLLASNLRVSDLGEGFCCPSSGVNAPLLHRSISGGGSTKAPPPLLRLRLNVHLQPLKPPRQRNSHQQNRSLANVFTVLNGIDFCADGKFWSEDEFIAQVEAVAEDGGGLNDDDVGHAIYFVGCSDVIGPVDSIKPNIQPATDVEATSVFLKRMKPGRRKAQPATFFILMYARIAMVDDVVTNP
jgi:hypothetical protein